jgi:hypothetical protein
MNLRWIWLVLHCVLDIGRKRLEISTCIHFFSRNIKWRNCGHVRNVHIRRNYRSNLGRLMSDIIDAKNVVALEHLP